MKPIACRACGTIFQGSSSHDPCPHCSGYPLDQTLVSGATDAPPVVVIPDSEIMRFAVEPPESPRCAPVRLPREAQVWNQRECPRCAELIKLKAKVCRFCGHEIELEVERRPFGRERRRDRLVPRRSLAHGGDCFCGGYRVEKTPTWAVVLAVLLFPFGLLFLIVKERRCSSCGR